MGQIKTEGYKCEISCTETAECLGSRFQCFHTLEIEVEKVFLSFQQKTFNCGKRTERNPKGSQFCMPHSLERVTQLKEDSMECQDILKKCFVLFFWKNSQCRLLKKMDDTIDDTLQAIDKLMNLTLVVKRFYFKE